MIFYKPSIIQLTQMDLRNKGQTAMEYLLFLVVIIAIVVVLMMFLQGSTTSQRNETTCNVNSFLCSIKTCGNDSDCRTPSNVEACGTGATCDIMGKCVSACGPMVTYTLPVCNAAIVSGLTCNRFDSSFSTGIVTCGPGGMYFDVSDCYKEGVFNDVYDVLEWRSWGTASGDVICDWSYPVFNIGDNIEITDGPKARTYTVSDFGVESGFAYYNCPIFSGNPNLLASGEASISWSYRYKPSGNPQRPRIPNCTNGIVEPEVGEVCDGANLNGKNCGTIGRGYATGGTLACKPGCLDWETSGCYYYEGATLGASDYSCCGGDIICSNYVGSRCGGTCMGKKVTITGGSLPLGTYNIPHCSFSLGGGIAVNWCGTPSQISLGGLNIPACGSDRPCPAGADGAGSTYRIHD